MKLGIVGSIPVTVLFCASFVHAQELWLPNANLEAKLSEANGMTVTISPCEKKRILLGGEKEKWTVVKLKIDRPVDVYAHIWGKMDTTKMRLVDRSLYVKAEGDPGVVRIIEMQEANTPQRWNYTEAIIACVNVTNDKREGEESVVLIGLQRQKPGP